MREGHIFVGIASFRDPECQWTVKDLFEKAAHPDRVAVGICWQFDPAADAGCFVVPPPRPRQVRVRSFRPEESRGAGWARAVAQGLWSGEEYALVIDAHMRFAPGWDDTLIDMLRRCPTGDAVVSGYTPRYTPPDRRDDLGGRLPRGCVERLAGEHDPQVVHQIRTHVPPGDERAGLYPAPFIVANFLFARSGVFRSLPFDPHIQFWGDEVAYSARLWTHGYDVYQPDRVVLHHYWRRDEGVDRGAYFAREPYRRLGTPRSRAVRARIRHLLGLERAADPAALADLEDYPLGTARRLGDLWAFAGIDWRRGTVTADARRGRWDLAARPAAGGGEHS